MSSLEESHGLGIVLKEGFWWGRLLLGPSAKSVGENLGKATDHFFEQLLKNRTAGAQLIDYKVLEGNVKVRPINEINLKILGPLIEGISLESDDNLRELWANLFVNYLDSEKNLTLTVYPGILGQISTSEAKVLLYMYQQKDKELDFRDHQTALDYDIEQITNLERLNLINEKLLYKVIQQSPSRRERGDDFEDQAVESMASDIMKLTGFGENFLDACMR